MITIGVCDDNIQFARLLVKSLRTLCATELPERIDCQIAVEFSSCDDVLRYLEHNTINILFLDINMPEATGLQLADALQHLKFPPAVVFVTAYSEYAIDAFKVNAVDYLVKPVETERLAQAISRVREHVMLHAKVQKAERIPVEKGGKKILINIDDIRFVMARDDYAYLQTDTDRFFSTVSLAQLEKTLDGHGFFRVHRGYLVNLALVKEVEPQSGGTLLLTLDSVEDKIPVSRRRVSSLKKALGL
jgi:two-component system response regulator LytT